MTAIDMELAKFLRGSVVVYMDRFKPWEEPDFRKVTILGTTAKRVRILDGDTVRLVRPTSLLEKS